MDATVATRNNTKHFLGGIISDMDKSYPNNCEQKMPENNFRKIPMNGDPLGLETEFPTTYMKMVGKLIKKDFDPNSKPH